MKKVFEVKTLIDNDKIWVALYTANHMQEVINEIQLDLLDAAMTVLSIEEKGEILKELK